MKNLFAAFFLLLLIPFFSAAQNNYKPGYIVTLKGDTLQGFIDCKTGNRNPVKFTFKDSLNSGHVQTFSATDTRAFVIAGDKIYKSFVVEVSKDKAGEDTISTPFNAKHFRDTVFLNLIDSGKNVTLYQYTDKIKERFFINEKNSKPVELILHIYPDHNHLGELVRQEIYKRQLQRLAVKYLAQYQPVIDEVQETAYTKDGIEKIVFEINGADKATTFTSTKEFKSRVIVGFGLNALFVHNFATTDYLPTIVNNYPYVTTQQSASAELNLGEDFFPSQKEKSIILRIETHVTYSGNSTIKDVSSGDVIEQYHTITASINPQILFNIYDSGDMKIYLGAGGQFFPLGGAKVSYVRQDYYELNAPAYYAWSFIFTTRADIILNNRIDIYAGYSPPADLQQNTVSSFRAGINYLFGTIK